MTQGDFVQAACIELSSVRLGKLWMVDTDAEGFDTRIALGSQSKLYSGPHVVRIVPGSRKIPHLRLRNK